MRALIAAFALSLLASPVAYARNDLAAAVASPNRAPKASDLDASRKPAEVLAFFGYKPGMAAADIMTGSGYWAEIMANAAGPKGKVTAFEPQQFYTGLEEQKQWAALVQRRPDIAFVRYPFEAFASQPSQFDFAIINLSYHDLYWESKKYKIPRTDPAAFLRTLYAAMKPGGLVGIVDHAGPAGDTRAIVEKLYRIDPAVVKADFAAAGFKLEAESPLLANPGDDGNKLVFDPSLRGRTDRFVFRFRKPR